MMLFFKLTLESRCILRTIEFCYLFFGNCIHFPFISPSKLWKLEGANWSRFLSFDYIAFRKEWLLLLLLLLLLPYTSLYRQPTSIFIFSVSKLTCFLFQFKLILNLLRVKCLHQIVVVVVDVVLKVYFLTLIFMWMHSCI